MRFVHVRSAPVSSCPRMAVVISRSYMMGGGGWIVSVCNDLIHILLVVVCVGGIYGVPKGLWEEDDVFDVGEVSIESLSSGGPG